MKKTIKKYPLLICLIISVVIIISSLFVIGFAGLKFDTSIVGGTQVEIVLDDDANSQEYANSARVICKNTGLSLYGVIVEDKFTAGEVNGEYTKRVLILTFAERDISEEKQLEYRESLAEKLGFENADKISDFRQVTNMVESKNIWLVVLSLGIVVICAFVFAWIRYDIFAGITFILAYLHNIILYFALSGITRIPIGLSSLSIMAVLTFVMSAVLVHIFEEYRKTARLHIDDKLSTSERLLNAEKKALIPYIFIVGAVVAVCLIMMLSPSFMARLAILSIFVCLVVCAYTVMLVAPALYAYLTDLGIASQKARLSRNETKNKAIKKKVSKNNKQK